MKNLLSLASAFLVCVSMLLSCSPSDNYITITGFAQGGTYTVKLNLNTSKGALTIRPEAIKSGVDSILAVVDNSLSGYNKGSLLSRFNRGETIVPDEVFLNVYDRCREYYIATGGVVDPAAAPLFDIWGFGFTSGTMPSDSLISLTKASCGSERLKCDIRGSLDEDGSLAPSNLLNDSESSLPQLNYNAVAQGYSCDIVADYLALAGVEDMLVDIGGEIFCSGLNPSRKRWSVGVDRPVDGNNERGADMKAVIALPEGSCGIVTSGNYRKFYVRDGRKYAHTIDPRTGYPVTHNLLSATLIMKNAADADAYATYCMAVGLERAQEFIESSENVEGYLIYDDEGQMRSWYSSGLDIVENR